MSLEHTGTSKEWSSWCWKKYIEINNKKKNRQCQFVQFDICSSPSLICNICFSSNVSRAYRYIKKTGRVDVDKNQLKSTKKNKSTMSIRSVWCLLFTSYLLVCNICFSFIVSRAYRYVKKMVELMLTKRNWNQQKKKNRPCRFVSFSLMSARHQVCEPVS